MRGMIVFSIDAAAAVLSTLLRTRNRIHHGELDAAACVSGDLRGNCEANHGTLFMRLLPNLHHGPLLLLPTHAALILLLLRLWFLLVLVPVRVVLVGMVVGVALPSPSPLLFLRRWRQRRANSLSNTILHEKEGVGTRILVYKYQKPQSF